MSPKIKYNIKEGVRKNMNTFTIELSLDVYSFLSTSEINSTEIFCAFEDAKAEKSKVRDQFNSLTKGLNAEIIDIQFIEFDSSNIHHANAYYLVTYKAKYDLENIIYPE